jgi:hypothetical protein
VLKCNTSAASRGVSRRSPMEGALLSNFFRVLILWFPRRGHPWLLAAQEKEYSAHFVVAQVALSEGR